LAERALLEQQLARARLEIQQLVDTEEAMEQVRDALTTL
jgi:hypothetical protein